LERIVIHSFVALLCYLRRLVPGHTGEVLRSFLTIIVSAMFCVGAHAQSAATDSEWKRTFSLDELVRAATPTFLSEPQSAGGGHSTSSLEQAQRAQAEGDMLTEFPHSDDTPWYIAGQANIIFQAHPGFHSPYSGKNSLLGGGEYKTSLLGTVYTAYQVQRLFNRPATGSQSPLQHRLHPRH
jgi:hypothetical protein